MRAGWDKVRLLGFFLWVPVLWGQASLSGRVVDENGGGVAGARVELRAESGGAAVAASTDPAGNFRVVLPAEGSYTIRAERLGYYVYQGQPRSFEAGSTELHITLNHLQEFSDRIDVTYSPPAIDPAQPAERKELTSTEIQTIPYPAPQDFRNALQLMDGVVTDNSGGPTSMEARPARPTTPWTVSTSRIRSPAGWTSG